MCFYIGGSCVVTKQRQTLTYFVKNVYFAICVEALRNCRKVEENLIFALWDLYSNSNNNLYTAIRLVLHGPDVSIPTASKEIKNNTLSDTQISVSSQPEVLTKSELNDLKISTFQRVHPNCQLPDFVTNICQRLQSQKAFTGTLLKTGHQCVTTWLQSQGTCCMLLKNDGCLLTQVNEV